MPDYFDVLGIPLVRGRLFDDRDEDEAPQEAIVDETWARRFFPGESSVGRRFRDGGRTTGPWVTVVGVVGDVIYTGLDAIGGGTVYRPMSGGCISVEIFSGAHIHRSHARPSIYPKRHSRARFRGTFV